MSSKISTARAVILLTGGLMLMTATSTASAQRRRDPRVAVAAQPRPEPRAEPKSPVTSWLGVTERPTGPMQAGPDERHRQQRGHTRVIYVPVPAEYGYGYGYGYSYGTYPSVVRDANGRPLSGYDETPPSAGGYGYTPDLSGAPYVIDGAGNMVVDFDSGARRAFPSCVASSEQRDPQGRPRTIFYRSTDSWMIQRPGQRGRVRGEPPAGTAACYAIDPSGRPVLRF